MVESSDKNVVYWRREWQTTSVFLPWEPHKQYEKAKNKILKDELPRSTGARYATGEEMRNSSRRNEEAESKQKQHPVVDVSDGKSKVWCYKEQCCTGNWNVRSLNQGKLEVVKQEMARVNTYEFNSYDYYIYYCGQESLRRNGVALIVNKSL